ncbi:MAG TPA: hypothetical protein VET51_09065 [Burkholderiales bacterium]|nr:hypothetical protein [Burkholderiales bacterium]
MRRYNSGDNVELLLKRDGRARLPLARQLLLYLDPFALFKDASQGPAPARQSALSYNRAMRWMLLPYLRRWVAIGSLSYLAILPTEALAAQSSLYIIPTAAFAVGCCIALTVTAMIVTVYFLLGK